MSSPAPSQSRDSLPTIEEARAEFEQARRERHRFPQVGDQPAGPWMVRVSEATASVLLASEAQLQADLLELLEAWSVLPAGHHKISVIQRWMTEHMAPAFAKLKALYEKHKKEKTDGQRLR